MKKLILILTLCFYLFSNAQDFKCDYEISEKTDSTYIKKTADYLMHERDFMSSKSFLFFSLLNSDGTPYLGFRLLQKSKDFIKANCFDKNSKISIQLTNGKIITLFSNEESCSQLLYDEKEKNNIRILNGYFLFPKDGYNELKQFPISVVKIIYATGTADYVFSKELKSETIKGIYYPETYLMNYLKCVE